MANEFTALTEDEEKSPLAKYFYREKARPNPRIMEILSKGPMDPAKALPIERFDDLLDPGYHEVENGYCILDDGTGYICANNVFPNCTVDMIKWWFAWHCLEDIRYKIWDPVKHGAISVSDAGRKKVLDPNIPIEEKYADIVHCVVEDVGGGYEDIEINFKTPAGMGFNEEKLKKSPVKAIFGGFGISENREHRGNKIPAIMMHTCREKDGGAEFRTRFYMGCRLDNGVPVCALPQGARVPIEAPMGLAFHSVEEYSNLAVLLPDVYKEFGPGIS